jgi:hypothetical protein
MIMGALPIQHVLILLVLPIAIVVGILVLSRRRG